MPDRKKTGKQYNEGHLYNNAHTWRPFWVIIGENFSIPCNNCNYKLKITHLSKSLNQCLLSPIELDVSAGREDNINAQEMAIQ